MAVTNGKMKIIWILAGWLFIVATTAFAMTWTSVIDNRKNIQQVKECVSETMEKMYQQNIKLIEQNSYILQRVTRIEAKIE